MGVVFCALPVISFANVPEWKIILEKSSIEFTATQNNAPVTVGFKSFHANVEFDPDKLEESHVCVVIDMNSVNAEFEDLVLTLKSPEWFDVEKFPTATFESTKFTKTEKGDYHCEGNLTIRDRTLPITIDFELKKYTSKDTVVEGLTTIKRSDFGVGQGEWANTDEIRDKVITRFMLVGVKK